MRIRVLLAKFVGSEVVLRRAGGRNALSMQVLNELRQIANALRGDTSVHAIILTGEPAFSAGADLKDPALAVRTRAGLLERREMLRAGPDACDAWAALDQVTICAIEGYCIGGGVSLSVACDFRVAAQDAYFRLPEIPLGMNMSWHTLPRLTALMGPARTKWLTIMGEPLEAPTAQTWGLVDILASPGEALHAARSLAAKVVALPPVAIRMSKRTITEIAAHNAALASHMDLDQFALAATGEDNAEAIQAFLERRAPKFTGR